jgi:hypothetical protein
MGWEEKRLLNFKKGFRIIGSIRTRPLLRRESIKLLRVCLVLVFLPAYNVIKKEARRRAGGLRVARLI